MDEKLNRKFQKTQKNRTQINFLCSPNFCSIVYAQNHGLCWVFRGEEIKVRPLMILRLSVMLLCCFLDFGDYLNYWSNSWRVKEYRQVHRRTFEAIVMGSKPVVEMKELGLEIYRTNSNLHYTKTSIVFLHCFNSIMF